MRIKIIQVTTSHAYETDNMDEAEVPELLIAEVSDESRISVIDNMFDPRISKIRELAEVSNDFGVNKIQVVHFRQFLWPFQNFS